MRAAWHHLRFAPAATWAGAIWFASSFDWRRVHLPGDDHPGAGFSAALHALMDALPGWIAADKAVHTAIFAVFACLLLLPSRLQRGAVAAAAAWALATAWGGLDELHQSFVPGRSMDALDLLADAIGATLGVSGVVLSRRSLHGATTLVRAHLRPRAEVLR